MGTKEKTGRAMGHIGTAITTLGLHNLLTKKIEKQLEVLPRPYLDYLIDHLDDIDKLNEEGSEAKKAADQLKIWLTEVDKKGGENRTARALCTLLELDKKEDGNYDLDYPRARRRLKEYGLMTREDFWQSIEFLIDDPIKEFLSHFIGKPVKNKAKEAKRKAKQGIKKASETVKVKRDEINDEASSTGFLRWTEQVRQKTKKWAFS